MQSMRRGERVSTKINAYVTLKFKPTGATANCPTFFDGEFWWTEGNGSCDCNRWIEIIDSFGLREFMNIEKISCTIVDKFELLELKDLTGKILYKKEINND